MIEYKEPTKPQADLIRMLEGAAEGLYTFLQTLPNSRERSLALTKVDEALLWARQAAVQDEK